MVTAMSPFPDGSSMVKTCPTKAGPPPPPPLTPPAAPALAIRAPGSGCGPPGDSEEAGAEAEETGRRSGTARRGAAGEGAEEDDEAAVGDEEARKGKVEAREWKGLEEERGMVVDRWRGRPSWCGGVVAGVEEGEGWDLGFFRKLGWGPAPDGCRSRVTTTVHRAPAGQ